MRYPVVIDPAPKPRRSEWSFPTSQAVFRPVTIWTKRWLAPK